MTYTQAQLIVHNPRAYTQEQVRRAASLILSNMTPTDDDYSAAVTALSYR